MFLGEVYGASVRLSQVIVKTANEEESQVVIAAHMIFDNGHGQDYGTGKETPRGNSGDIGREKKRKRRRWFSKKYYSSVMNIRDFFADNLGREFQGIIADSFDDKTFRRTH